VAKESAEFVIAEDEVDPDQVPKKTLVSGAQIPALGLGTFGLDRFSGAEVAETVKGATAAGYWHTNCAAVYGYEDLIGKDLQEILASGLIKREDLRDRTGK